MKFVGFLLTAVVCLFFFLASNDPLCVYLTLNKDPFSSVTVHWISTPFLNEATIYYRQEKESSWKKQVAKSHSLPIKIKANVYTTTLSSLTPGKTYLFRIGHSKIYRFRTVDDNPKTPIRFTVGGDMFRSTFSRYEKTCLPMARLSPDFALLGGDIAYSVRTKRVQKERWQKWILWLWSWSRSMITPEGYSIPMIPALGNHEVLAKTKRAKFFHLLFPELNKKTFYAVDFGHRLSIIALDTNHTTPIQGKQTDWLRQSLQERVKTIFIFPFYHVPAYPSFRKFDVENNALIRQHWVPLFEQYRVKAAFEHHEHTFKRTHPLYQNAINKERGVVYFGDGAWGVTPRQPNLNRWYLAKAAPLNHFYFVTIKQTTCTVDAIDQNGHIFDQVNFGENIL